MKPAALFAVLLPACTSSGVVPTGDHTYAALAASAPVHVYASEKDVPTGFEVLGIIDYANPGKYQVLSLQDAVPDLEKKARSVGANGLIIDGTDPVKSGIISTGVHVRARAIRLATLAIPSPTAPAGVADAKGAP